MSTTETVLLIGVVGPVVLILSNIAFQVIAERRNPPIGSFIECDGVRLHYIERGNAARLVLASGYYFPTFRMDFWLMSGPAVPLLGDLVRYTIAPIISWAVMPKLIRTLFAPCAVPPEFKNEFPISLSVRPKQLRAAAEESAFLIPVVAQLQHQYQSIRCPVRIVHGRGDRLIEIAQSRRLHEALPRSVLHPVRDAGHMVTYADTIGIADAVAVLALSAPMTPEVGKQALAQTIRGR
jgi:pimeloyl-ACP methyl ester carboxylesterase